MRQQLHEVPANVPVLETERLLLRGHTRGDLEQCAAIWADPDVARFTSGDPLSREETWKLLLRYAGSWALCGYGYWAVTSKLSGCILGEVGFANHQRDIDLKEYSGPEAGWVLASSAVGRGIALEAMTAATSWLEKHIRPIYSTCIIDPRNDRSIRLALRLGYAKQASTVYKGSDILVFSRSCAQSGGNPPANVLPAIDQTGKDTLARR